MDIRDSKSGKVIRSPSGYGAFVPNPLPPEIVWTDQLVASLSRADFILGKLSREGAKLPNPHLLIRPFIIREAVLSSKIEGTQATVGEVLAHSVGAATKQSPDDLQEVQNYIAALDYGIERLKDLPVSVRLIKEIHEKLMFGVRGANAAPGEFRKSQNWIGPAGCTQGTARFVPPPANHLLECMSDLEKFFHDARLPTLIHIALCHYQFETIHPFLDGNGRVGRLLIILLMIDKQVLNGPLLYISAFFEATRAEYYRQLYSVSRNGSWDDWLEYFLNGVAVQAEDVLSRAERINGLLNQWKLMVGSTSAPVAEKIVDRFAVNPYLTIGNIAEDLDIAYSTAQRAVARLVEKKIIDQIGEGKRDKLYCATQILEILEEPAKIYAE